MVTAMHEDGLEPPIIEDLVLYGRDRGFREAVEANREALEAARRQGLEAGRREGIEAGRREGVEAERRILLRLLKARFGQLSEEIVARVRDADAAKLERWAERVIEAKSADEATMS